MLYGYYVMFMYGGQYSTGLMVLWKSFFKNLLHKFFFECKGPWMLKTDSLIF